MKGRAPTPPEQCCMECILAGSAMCIANARVGTASCLYVCLYVTPHTTPA
jgi:hypothetical protein